MHKNHTELSPRGLIVRWVYILNFDGQDAAQQDHQRCCDNMMTLALHGSRPTPNNLLCARLQERMCGEPQVDRSRASCEPRRQTPCYWFRANGA